MATTETKHYLYTAAASPAKIKSSGWSAGSKSIRYRLVEGKTYICSATDKPKQIKVSGFFFFNYFQGQWSEKPGFADAIFSTHTCKQFLKFTETFITKHHVKKTINN